MFELPHKQYIVASLLGLLLIPVLALAAPDYPREKRWAEEIIEGLLVGQPIYLSQQNSHRFLGLHAEVKQAKMGVVVVHGMGLHPDWGVISTLRQRLFDLGYTTLSIQMPVLAADASPKEYSAVFPEAAERLQLAVNYLKKKGHRHIAIVSHSNGSRMSRVYMSNNPPDVTAWVALSLTQGETFDGINTPILDLYGEHDLPHVLSSTAARKTSIKSTAASKQMVIPDTDHFYSDHEEIVIKAINQFLSQLHP